jgi:hypothetical protein
MSEDLPSARVVRDDLAAPPPTPESKFEADLAAFSRANHHRWGIAWAGAAIASLGLAVVLAFVAYASSDFHEELHPGNEYRVWIYAAGFVALAIALGWRAVRVWRGADDQLENLRVTSSGSFDAELAQFTTHARHRDVFILAIASTVCFALGLVIAIVGVVAKQGSDHTWAQARGQAGELRMFLYAVGFAIAGGFLARSAYQRARQR